MKRRLMIAAVVVLTWWGRLARRRGRPANALLAEGKAQQAIDLLAPVVQADPKNQAGHPGVGTAYWRPRSPIG